MSKSDVFLITLVEHRSQEEERYHEVNDCITRITNDPLFEVYQKHSKNDKLVTLKSAIKRKTLYSHQLGVTMSDLFLWELIKNHQDASTEFIVRLANDTLPASTNEQHELLTQ